jgi:hypothetical protein
MKHQHFLAALLLIVIVAAEGKAALFGKSNSHLSGLDRTQKNPQTKARLKISAISNLTSKQPASVSKLNIIHGHATKTAASVIVGTVLTFVLNNILALGPVQASSVVTLFVSLVLPEKLAIAAACGSFAGMAKTSVIPTVNASLLLGALCALMMMLFDKQKWLIGVGGRLGFIAQCACTAQFIMSLHFRIPSESAALVGAYPAIDKMLLDLPSVSFFTVVGAVYTKLWKQVLANQSLKATNLQPVYKRLATTVAAVGVTGLLATLVSPPSIAGPIFCGSFIAMSSPAKLDSFGALIGASLLGGLSQQLLAGVLLGGWGGKLGTASLMGVVFYNVLLKVEHGTAAKIPNQAHASGVPHIAVQRLLS